LVFLKNISASSATDAELIALYRQTNDLKALGGLYERYMELVYGLCLKYLEDTEASKDAVMQIFEEIVEKLLIHEVNNFKAWLHTVAKNHCLMKLRSSKNKKTVSIDINLMQSADEFHLNGELEKEEEFKKLKRCMQALSVEQKLAIELFYLQQKCYDDIAKMTGLNWNKVRSLIQNGRRNLKICIEKETLSDQQNVET
jgi:RNA polymerase sigma-70 factor (ECF subfamily)